jgi:hypothetical protein
MRKSRAAAALVLTILVVVTVSFFAGASFARRAAVATTRRPASQEPRPAVDARSVVVAKLLILALRQRGTSVLADLPQATDDDLQHVGTAINKVVQLEGELRDVQFDDGLFFGTIASRETGPAYFVTPIATEGIVNHRNRRFRGVPVPVHAGANAATPALIVVGAFDAP